MEGESEGGLDGEERAHVMENGWCVVEESKQGTLWANMKAATSGERSQVALWSNMLTGPQTRCPDGRTYGSYHSREG